MEETNWKMIVGAALLAVVAAGGAAFGWMQYHDHAQTRTALKNSNTDLQKTRTDLKSTQDELIALRKRYSEQELALQQLQAEMATARAFVEAEKAVGARLRDDLAKQKEESAAALDKARASQSGRLAPPSVIDAPQPGTGRARRGVTPAPPP